MEKRFISFLSKLMVMVAMCCLPMLAHADVLTVYDGTTTGKIPTDGWNDDNYTRHSQFIIPASELEDMVSGSEINGFTFYNAGTTAKTVTNNYQVRLVEVAETSFSTTSYIGVADATLVYQGGLTLASNGALTIAFTTPYTYGGGNLLVDFRNTTSGSYFGNSSGFYGQFVTNGSLTATGVTASTGTRTSFCPKTTFDYTPGSVSCEKPLVPSIGTVTTNSVGVTILGEAGSNCEYKVVPAGAKADDVVAVAVTPTAGSYGFTISGLQAATTYQVYLRRVCGADDASAWVKSESFTTNCERITSFPWTEDFEGRPAGDLNDPCWANVHTAGTATSNLLWQVSSSASSTYSNDGSHGIYHPYNATGNKTILALPEMYIPTANAYEFSFWMYRNNSSSYATECVNIYSSADATVDASDVLLKTVHLYNGSTPVEPTTGWYQYLATIPSVGVQHIIIELVSQFGSYTYLDNFEVREKPACTAATDLAVAEAYASDRVKFTWEHAEANDFLVSYSCTEDAAIHGEGVEVNGKELEVSGLQMGKTYHFTVSVKAVCAAGEAVDVLTRTLTTTTLCGQVSLPFVEGFEDFATGSESSAAPNCWALLNANDGSYPYIYVYTNSSYVHSGSKSLYFRSSSSRDGYAIFPEVADLTNTHIRFWYKDENASSSGRLFLGYMTDIENATSFVQIAEIARTTTMTQTDWIDIPAAANGHRLAFKYAAQSQNYYLGIDDIELKEIPSCLGATNLHVVAEAATANSIKLAWDHVSATQFKVSYTCVENPAIQAVEQRVSANELEISGLAHSSTYHFNVSVVAVCGEGNEAVDVLSANNLLATTACGLVDPLTFFEGFSATAPACWTIPSDGVTFTTYASWSDAGHLVKFATTDVVNLILPEFDVATTPLSACQIVFKYRNEGTNNTTSGHIKVGYINAADEFVMIQDFPNHVFTPTEVEVSLKNVPAGVNKLAFQYYGATSAGWYFFVDDVKVEKRPNVHPVKNIRVVETTYNSVTFAWDPAADNYNWLVQFKEGDGAITSTATAYHDDTTLIVSGLDPDTDYTYRVKVGAIDTLTAEGERIADIIDLFAWNEAVLSFRTKCAPETITAGPGDTIAAWDFEEGFVRGSSAPYFNWDTTCFQSMAVEGSYAWMPYQSASYANSGAGYLLMGTGSSYYTYGTNMHSLLVLPGYRFNGDPNSLEFSFRAATYSKGATRWVKVWANTIPSLEGATRLDSINLDDVNYNDYAQVAVQVPNNGVFYLMIEGYTTNYSIYLDDMVLRRKPECKAPTKGAVRATGTNSAELTWTKGGDEAGWRIVIKESQDAETSLYDDEPFIDEPVFQLADAVEYNGAGLMLQPATTYSYYYEIFSECAEKDTDEHFAGVLTFTTDCENVVLGSEPWAENFDNVPVATFDSVCWVNEHVSGSGTNTFKVVTSTSVNNSTHMLQLPDQSAGTVTRFGLPVMHVADASATYQLKLDLLRNDYSSGRVDNEGIYVVLNGDSLAFLPRQYDMTSDQFGYHVSAVDATNTWVTYAFDLTPSADGLLAIELIGLNQYKTATYIDNLLVRQKPACPAPTDLTTAVTHNSLTLAWTPAEANKGFYVTYKHNNGTIATDDDVVVSEQEPVYVNEPRLVIGGLAANTSYVFSEIVISAACEGSNSEESLQRASLSFTTLCAPVEIPFVEDFEDEVATTSSEGGSLPSCWNNINVANSSSYPNAFVSSGYEAYRNGAKGLFMQSSSSKDEYIILPSFGEADLTACQISFVYRNESLSTSNSNLVLGHITNIADASSFVVDSILPIINVKTKETIELDKYEIPAGARLAFRYGHNGSNMYCGLDDIKVELIPSCKDPMGAVVTGITTNAATVTVLLQEGVNNVQECQVALNGDYEHIYTSSNIAVALSALTAGARYSVEVRVSCDGGTNYTEWVAAGSFDTQCETIAAFPWSEDFDSFDANTAMADIPCYTSNWFDGEGYITNTTTKPWSISTTNPNSGTKSLYAMYTGAQSLAQLALPKMNIPAGYEFVFSAYRANSTSYLTDEVRVFVNSTPDTIGATRLLGVHRAATEAPAVAETNVHHQYRVSIPEAGEQYIVLQYYSQNGVGMYFDDFQVRAIPSCNAPTNLVAGASTANSVSFSWTAASEGQTFHLTVKKGEETLVDTDVEEPAYTIEGLDAGKNYALDIAVTGVCGGVESVDVLSGTLNMATECPASIVLSDTKPFSEDFEGISTGIPTCWAVSGTTTTATSNWSSYVCTSSNGASREGRVIRFNSYSNSNGNTGILATPAIEIPSDMEAEFSFACLNPTGGAYKVQISTSDDNHASKTTLVSGLTSIRSWQTKTVDLAEYTGKTIIIYFDATSNYGSSDAYMYLDDVQVRKAPSCKAPTNLVAGASTTSSVSFSWTPNVKSPDASFRVEVKNGAEDVANVSVDGTTATISGLTAATAYTYSIKVYSVCEGEGESQNALEGTLTLVTDCETKSLPYSEGFESSAVLADATAAAPICWSTLIANEGAYPYVYVNNSSSYVHGGSKSLYFKSSDTKYAYAILPVIDGLDNARIRFWYKDESATSSGKLYVGYMTDATDEESFVAIQEVERTTIMSQTPWISIPAEAAGNRLAFKYGGASNNYYLGIDDIEIEEKPACAAPLAMTVSNVTTGSFAINIEHESASTFSLSLTSTNASFEALENVEAGANYLVEGLEANTSYTFTATIRTLCGSTPSEEALVKTFTVKTSCEAIEVTAEVPFVCDFEDVLPAVSSAYGMPDCWDRVAYVSTYSTYPYVGNSTYSSHVGSKYLYLTGGTAIYAGVTAILPMLTAAQDLEMELYYKLSSTGANYGKLVVGYMDGTELKGIDTLAQASTYTKAVVAIPAAAQGKKLAMAITDGAVYTTYIYVDDITVRFAPTCKAPKSLSVVAASTTATATVNVPEGATFDHVSVHVTGTDFDQTFTSTTNVVEITGLTGNGVRYSATAKLVCSASDESEECASVSFVTECEPAGLPFKENFESALSTCWPSLPAGVTRESSTYYAPQGSYALKFATTSTVVVTLPAVDAESYAGLTLSFQYRSEGTGTTTSMGFLKAGYIDNDGNFQAIWNDGELHVFAATSATVAMDAVPDGATIAFQYYGATSSGWYFFLDDLRIGEPKKVINFKDRAGAVLYSAEYEVGETPVYGGANVPNVVDGCSEYHWNTANKWTTPIVPVVDDADYVANYTEYTRSFTIGVAADATGELANQSVDCGAELTLTAGAAPEGKQFVHWASEKDSKDAQYILSTENPYTFEVFSAANYYAVYANLITIHVKNGMAADFTDVDVAEDAFYTVVAEDVTGYAFKGWKNAAGDVLSLNATFTFQVTEEISIEAQYEQSFLTDVIVLPNGQEIPVNGQLNEQTSYEAPATITVDEGLATEHEENFIGWVEAADDSYCDIVSSERTLPMTIIGNKRYYAIYGAGEFQTATNGKWGTYVARRDIEYVKGATFFEIGWWEGRTLVLAEVACGESLESGKPYIYYAENEGNEMLVVYSDPAEELATAVDNRGDGLVGVAADFMIPANADNYILTNNRIALVTGDKAGVRAWHAYIHRPDVPTEQPVQTVGRRTRRISMDAETATYLDQLEAMIGHEGADKFVEDGIFYIVRDGKVFGAQGQFIKMLNK